jgi:hypothetical protein
MSLVKEFIKENINKQIILIPWELHPHFKFDDIAFISLLNNFVLDKTYYSHVRIDNETITYIRFDNIWLAKRFDNYMNICLLMAIKHEGRCTMIDGRATCDTLSIFNDNYIESAWEFAVENNLTNCKFGNIVRKLKKKQHEDNQDFVTRYLHYTNVKSARNVV